MKEFFAAFGAYNVRARLSIGIILIAPWILEMYLFVPEIQKVSSTIIVILIGYALCNLIIIYCRVPGTKAMKECFPDLLPAQQSLLPSSQYIDEKSKERYYKFLSEYMDEFVVSKEDVEMKPYASAAVTWLIAQTRDTEKFPLIAEENINFGFSYNMLGMKPAGIGICILGILINSIFGVLNSKQIIMLKMENIIIGFCINTLFLLVWIFIINQELVITSGKKYARALLAACDSPHLKN